MRQKIILLLIICFVFSVADLDARKKRKMSGKDKKKILESLSQRYLHWWNLVQYVSTDAERKVFLSLTNNRDRDMFIRTFWIQRDPTPGTEENEYRNEIEQRFAHVNKYFSRGVTRPGWMTDMGRFYMMLGKPPSIQYFDSKPGLYPAQVWYFYGDTSLGLPPHFNITFYKPHGTTEWKFYNPNFDGPAALLIKQGPLDENNYEALYDKIKQLAPALAMPALTMIPNAIDPGFRPPLRNNIVISNIYRSPSRRINASYATHFLNYKGFVDVEASVNYIENTHLVSITRYNRFDFNFVNFSFKPRKISVGYNDDKEQYFFNYEVTASLRKGEKFIYEYKKNFDFYIDKDGVEGLKGNGIVIHDFFPAVPGEYTLMVYAMNSVGKEFTYFEKKIKIPPVGKTPLLTTPVVGYKSQPQVDQYFFPYRFNDRKLSVDTGKTLKLKENPLVFLGVYDLSREYWETGRVDIRVRGLNERHKYEKTYTVALKDHGFRRNLNLLHRLGEGEDGLKPDYYEVELKLMDGSGNLWDSKNFQFGVSPLTQFAYPMETYKKIRADNPYLFYHTLATQYQKKGDLANAAAQYDRALQSKPDFKPALAARLDILNKAKKYTRVLVEVEKLSGATGDQMQVEYHLIKATALFGMKDYKEALDMLLKANAIYDSDLRVLNLLGFTLLNLKDYPEALKAFGASLSLNGGQKFIINTVEKVKAMMAKAGKPGTGK